MTSPTAPATVHAGRCYCPQFAPGHAPGLRGYWIVCKGDAHREHIPATCPACVATGKTNPPQSIGPHTFKVLAECANQNAGDLECRVVLFGVVDQLTPYLDTGEAAGCWDELLHCLNRAEAAATVGPAWDERGVDWKKRATEAADTLAGVR